MGRSILFLCVLAVLPSTNLANAAKGNKAPSPSCSKLLERKEWRTLTNSEKAEWVGAVKVHSPALPWVVRTLLTPRSA